MRIENSRMSKLNHEILLKDSQEKITVILAASTKLWGIIEEERVLLFDYHEQSSSLMKTTSPSE